MARARGRVGGRATFAEHREPLTGRSILEARTRGGTDVWVAPMPGFRSSYAMVTTRYGSLDTHLPDGTELPEGIAHFLEHKMFQTEEGDVFDVYAARGASANAFTTFDHTAYLFSCTSRFEENFETLLDTMASIHTDPAAVEREKGIIGQEIAMYDDDPSWRGYFGLLQSLYRRHPVRLDIAGTKQTIAPIDPAILERTHRAYYHPRNMVVAVAGDVAPGHVFERVEAVLASAHPGARNRRAPVAEPRAVAQRERRTPLPISRPHVYLGMKDRAPRSAWARVRQEVRTAVVLDVLFGDGGRVQTPLYGEGIVDDSFGASYEADRDYAHAVLSAEVDDVDVYRRRLERALRAAAEEGLTDVEIERSRRKLIGRHLRTFNSPDRLAHWMLAVALEGTPVDAGVAALREVTRPMLVRRMRDLLAAPRAWSVLVPRDDTAPAAPAIAGTGIAAP
jgi:predicted Zn-dependent peptidase